MKIEYDPVKNEKNIRERGLSFERVLEMDEDTALVLPDSRKEYGEPRFHVFGLLAGRLHVFVFTPRKDAMRIVSFRKCNAREERWYEEETSRPGED